MLPGMSAIEWGDVPTWIGSIAGIAATIGAFIAARIAFIQLREQREELRRQGAEQARMAELQTLQLDQLNRQAEALRRSQAEQVSVTQRATGARIPGGSKFLETVVVCNDSPRPIRRVRCRVIDSQGVRHAPVVAHLGAPPWRTNDDLPPEAVVAASVLRKQQELWLVTQIEHHANESGALVRFEDDAGNPWELDQHLHLAEPTDMDW